MSFSDLTFALGLLIDTALKGSLLILAAAIAAYLLRNRSASARHAAWTAAVIGHLALPVVTLLAPAWYLPILPAPPWLDVPAATATVTAAATDVGSRTETLPVAPAAGVAVTGQRASAPGQGIASHASATIREWPVLSVLGLLWIIGTLAVLLRLAIGTWRVGRLAKTGERVDDGGWLSLSQRLANGLGIARPLTLFKGDSLAVPVTWGVVYPAVLLPPDSDEWPEARRRFVLVHEMAHVKRFDALTQLLAQMTIAILWFDPLIWVAAHRMRVEREHACDDYVLRDGTTPSLYAGELLEMVQAIGSPRHDRAAPAFAALAMARRSEFEGRMLAILDPKLERHTLGRRSTMATAALVTLLVLPLAALRPFRADSPAPAPSIATALTGDSTAIVTAAVAATEKRISYTCDTVDVNAKVSGETVHIHVDHDDDEVWRELEYMARRQGRCVAASMIGMAAFSPDERVLTSLASGSTADFRELTSGSDRSVKVRRNRGGDLAFDASVNGRAVAFDSDMRSWLGGLLPEVLAESGVNAPGRVARLRRGGGVDGVLTAIRGLRSSRAKRVHYEALIESGRLSSSEKDKLGRQARKDLGSSSSDLSAVLESLQKSMRKTDASRNAAGLALDGISSRRRTIGDDLARLGSSTDSAQLLTQYAVSNDPEMILMALRGAKEISSDTDRRLLLQTIAARALGRKNGALRRAFFDATLAMTSDTDLRVTLTHALPYGHADPEVTLAIFKSVASMSSDSDKRVTLSAAIDQKLVKTPALREAFMVAARTIQSSTDFSILMQLALTQR